MKKLTFQLFAMVGLAGMSVLSSCNTDTDDPTPDPQGNPIRTHRTILLTNQNAQTASEQKSFYSVEQNRVYAGLAEAKTNSQNVDFVHVLRNQNSGGRLLTAPNSADATAIYDADPLNENRISTWATRNATKFKMVLGMDSATFAGINDDTKILQETESGVDQETVTGINVGDIIAFRTAGPTSKRGLARVVAVTGPAVFDPNASTTDNAGSITLDIKVQE